MSARATEISCTHCGAPLALHGGRRIEVVVCSHCGSELDARHEYAVLGRLDLEDDRWRPRSPIELGMSGTLRGIEFTVIGRVEYKQREDGVDYPWIEFLLFSPTHGYAWLCQELGHWVLAREVKDLPSKTRKSRLSRRSRFFARGIHFTVFEQATSSISRVEGELTWRAQPGDVERYADGVAPPAMFTITWAEDEIEFSYGEYLEPEEVEKAFGLEWMPHQVGIFSAQPFAPSPFLQSLSRASTPFLGVALAAILVVGIAFEGRVVLSESFHTRFISADGIESSEFEVTSPGSLMRMDLGCPVANAWWAFDIEVLKGDTRFFELSREISYYSGADWSEGSTRSHAYFRLPEAGRYRLAVFGQGGSGEGRGPPAHRELSVVVREGVVVQRYLVVFAAFAALSFLLTHLRRLFFQTRKWSEDEED